MSSPLRIRDRLVCALRGETGKHPAGAPRRPLGTAAQLTLAAAALAAGGHCSAAFRCTDAWGRQYLAPSSLASEVAGITCHPVGDGETDAATPREAASDTASLSPSAQQVLAAFGLPAPRPTAGTGQLRLIEERQSGSRAALARATEPPGVTAYATMPGTLSSLIEGTARAYGHEAALLKAIIHVESAFNPRAVSPKGAIGLMQVMPATALRMGVQQPQRALFEPEANLQAGARYLRLLMNMFPERAELAIAAYNAGEGAVLRYKREIPPYPETQAYVRKVLALYREYRGGF
ncbi:lytic transglycosylase domain-containing protein [Caldimonas brevitalea]|uniref:Soluble lytic murein transglycosylase n=1 Tax=Caldimonas brevitalea TaxID=413882 RepID=A0A0G3BMS5_9BURK|nr:lytic transglycosylase domain-containing protein [Caldimonas brevitalea]AKJ27820.1 soluble lytic murein transglycosylase [Caldimonas brevitalea]